MKKKRPHKRKWSSSFHGYPVGTIAFYGPDNTFASKVAVGFIEKEKAEPVMRTWFADKTDVRYDPKIGEAITAYLEDLKVKSISAMDRIIGCPHQEGIDYPEGEECHACPFWIGRDRFTGQRIN